MSHHGILTTRGRRDCDLRDVDPEDLDDVLNDSATERRALREFDIWLGTLPDGRAVELTCTKVPPLLIYRVLVHD